MLLMAALLAALPVAAPPQAVSNPFTKNAPAARVPRKRAPRRGSGGSATRSAGSVYYANCAAARAAGAAPVMRGAPGYSRKLDRDSDGVGCE